MDRRWLAGRELSPEADFRLFCLPYAGGGAAVYRAWQEAAPAGVQVLALEPPGRGTRLREAPFRRVAPLIRSLADALTDALDRPYALFGHSMGGLLAFELARALRRRPVRQPAHVFVSAAASPGTAPTRPLLHCATDDEIRRRLAELGGTPPGLLDNVELMELMLPVLRADFAVLETYEYRSEAPLSVPLTVLGGRADRIVPPKALGGWQRHTSAGSRLCLFPGDHFFLHGATADLMSTVLRDSGATALAGPARLPQ
ncbi:thioesterase II family protein [Micromonospora eburnea]|uniref:Surfactin synthase thioesterase subunit n=1 Tax=Micromonospora eburnea TaxID=227316 RepID=A0A1C6URZ2_9ACTN|nr:alpha/beta fold hydrolase [Micromonospora eburnea]SCL56884.1 Surfactin synthase thioesterase subunit [Micromonospora eburnea]